MSIKKITKKRNCPICGAKENKELYTQSFSTNFSHTIASCISCGFTFVNNTPDQQYYSKYYKEMSKYEHERDEPLHIKYCKIITKYCDKSSKVLDIGSSTGHLLYQLRKRGYKNLLGIDPSPMCKDLGKQKYNLNIETAELYSFSPKKKFDLIILPMVFEHLENVRDAVIKITKLLSDDGYVFISIPDAEKFYEKFEEPFGEFSTEHINFFSQSSIYQLMLNYTCCYMKSDGKNIYSLWKKGSPLATSLKKYIDDSSKKVKNITKIIENAPSNLIVWGAGSLTQRILTSTGLQKKIFKFVDRNESMIGKKLHNIEVISPEDISKYDNPILLSTFRFKEEMLNYIKDHKLKNKIIMF